MDLTIVNLYKNKKDAIKACEKLKKSIKSSPSNLAAIIAYDMNSITYRNGDKICFYHNIWQICGMSIDKLKISKGVKKEIADEYYIHTLDKKD